VSLAPKAPSGELLTRTTNNLIKPFEAVVLLLQAATLFTSVVNDRYRMFGAQIVIAVGIAHLGFAAFTLRRQGLLTSGHSWTAAWIALIFVVQMLLAHLVAPGDFAAYGVGIPAQGYALSPLAIFAFYPWGDFRNASQRRLIECCLILTIILHPLLLIGLMNQWKFTSLHVRSILQYGVWALVWFLVGKGIAWLCRIAVKAETGALSDSYQTALADIHTHLEIAARQIEAGYDPKEIAQRMRQVTYARRRQLLMEDDNVSAVDIFTNAIRMYGNDLTMAPLPFLGGLTIPREHAILLEQGLADLLKNVVDHGGGFAELGFTARDGMMTLDVRDSGPGLDQTRFAAPGSTLQRLRSRLLDRGGDIELCAPGSGGGAAIRLTLPLRPQR
jgi:hypothetical protein